MDGCEIRVLIDQLEELGNDQDSLASLKPAEMEIRRGGRSVKESEVLSKGLVNGAEHQTTSEVGSRQRKELTGVALKGGESLNSME